MMHPHLYLSSPGIYFFIIVLSLLGINSILPYCLLPLSSFYFSSCKTGFLLELDLSLLYSHYYFCLWDIFKFLLLATLVAHSLIILNSSGIKWTLGESSWPLHSIDYTRPFKNPAKVIVFPHDVLNSGDSSGFPDSLKSRALEKTSLIGMLGPGAAGWSKMKLRC